MAPSSVVGTSEDRRSGYGRDRVGKHVIITCRVASSTALEGVTMIRIAAFFIASLLSTTSFAEPLVTITCDKPDGFNIDDMAFRSQIVLMPLQIVSQNRQHQA